MSTDMHSPGVPADQADTPTGVPAGQDAPAHSKFSASAASRWMECPGSMVAARGTPSKGSIYAAWGTVAHSLSEKAFADNCSAEDFIGLINEEDGFQITVDREMVDCVSHYVTSVREMSAGASFEQAEVRVNYAAWLDVPAEEAWGTADYIALVGSELQVHDLKTGRGEVVDARDNPQLMLYAAGALLYLAQALGSYDDVETVRMVIHQPRVSQAPSEWSMPVKELVAWLNGHARSAACSVRAAEREAANGCAVEEWREVFVRPSEKACRWCPVKATCPALRDMLLDTVYGSAPADVSEFEDVGPEGRKPIVPDDLVSDAWLSACMRHADLIEDWVKAVRAEVERRLLAGESVTGFKLVAGRKAPRKWSRADEAEQMLREQFRLPMEKAYDMTVISPTSAERLAKAGDIGPRQWSRLQALIVRGEGKPSVAPVGDKREALDIKPVSDAFEATPDVQEIC